MNNLTDTKRVLEPNAWITVDEVAAHARVPARLIYNWVAEGRLRPARIGGRRPICLKAAWVDAFLEASAAESVALPR